MASVQYFVLYKYMHPTAKKPITNTTEEKYDSHSRFIKAYDATNIDTQEILAEENPENQKYDMLFMYDGLVDVGDVASDGVVKDKTLLVEKFARCNGEAWFVSSIHISLQSALDRAKPIVKSIGKKNVRVVKNVPIDITVHIE